MGKFRKYFALLVTGSLVALGAQIVNAPPAAACIGDCGDAAIFVKVPWDDYGYTTSGGGEIDDSSDSCYIFASCTTPTGTVEWFIDGVSQGVMDVFKDGSFGVNHPEKASFGGLFAQPEVGLHQFDWVYNGNFGEESQSYNGRIFQASSRVRLAQVATTSTAGDPTRFTATVTGFGASGSNFPYPPSGTVEIFDGGTVINVANLVDGAAVVDLVLDGAYEHQLTARYSGDRNFKAPGDLAPPIQHTITKATPNIALVHSASAPTVAGQDVTFTSTVIPPSSSNTFIPTGTVTFTDGDFTLGTATVNASGVATLTRQLGAGTHTIVSQYAGDQNFWSAAASLVHSVDKASATNVLNGSRDSTVFGEAFDLTSTLGAVAPAGGAPTGTVTFTDLSAKSTTLGTDTISGVRGDPTSVTTSALEVGSHRLTSTYSGDGNFNAQAASPILHLVEKANVTFALDQAKPRTVFGEPIGLTMTVLAHAPSVAQPTGTVTLLDTTTGAVLGTVALDAVGKASFNTVLSAGSHVITGTYNGDGHFNKSGAVQVTQLVDQATSHATLSSPSPSALGAATTLRATLVAVAPGAGTPTGLLQFFDSGRALGLPASVVNGAASLVVPSFSGGAHSLTASYLGDANFLGTTAARVHKVQCTRTVTGNLTDYRIPASGTTCIAAGASKTTLTIPAGARVSIVDSRLAGLAIKVQALGLVMCGSTATTINATGASGPVVLGDDLRSACLGNRITVATLASNAKGVTLLANTLSGNLTVQGTRGGRTIIDANSIGGALRCTNNVPVAANLGRPNTASSRTGECAAPSF